MNGTSHNQQQLKRQPSNGFESRLLNMTEWQPQQMGQVPDHVQRLWHTKNQLSKAQSDFDEILSTRSKTPASHVGALLAKDCQLTEQQQLIEQLQERLKILQIENDNYQIRLQQQQDTIVNQSKEIQRSSNQGQWQQVSAPFRAPSQFHTNQSTQNVYGSGIYAAPPSANVLGNSASPNTQRTRYGVLGDVSQMINAPQLRPSTAFTPQIPSYQTQPPALCETRSRVNHGYVNERGSPMPDRPGPGNQMEYSSSSSGNNRYATPPRPLSIAQNVSPQKPTPATSRGSDPIFAPKAVAPLRLSTPQFQTEVGRDFVGAVTESSIQGRTQQAYQLLFDKVVKYTYTYCNTPSNQKDSNMSPELKQAFFNAATKTTAFRLMSSQNSRYFMVAKIILQWLAGSVIFPASFDGLDLDIDSTIRANSARIFSTTPDAVRYVILGNTAQQYQALSRHPQFEAFIRDRTMTRANTLYQQIRQLFYQPSHIQNKDWEDLFDIVLCAHRLAIQQYSNIIEYRLIYPSLNEPFKPSNMTNMDNEYVNMPDEIIVERQGTVRLGALPQLLSRSLDQEGRVVCRTEIKAGILMKFQ